MERMIIVQGRLEELAVISNFNAKKLASLSGVSVRQLQRYFQRHFQSSPQSWLDERRLIVAAEQLLSGEPIKKIAIDLGFKHVSHFCRKFKRCYKMTPSQFTASQLSKCRRPLKDVAVSQSTCLEEAPSQFDNATVHQE